MIISNFKKIKNTKRVIRCTLGISGILISASLLYLFFWHGYNQAAILGTAGIIFFIHAGYVLSKKKNISRTYMAYSYLIAMCYLFVSWALISFFINEISGVVIFLFASVIALVGAHCMKKHGSK